MKGVGFLMPGFAVGLGPLSGLLLEPLALRLAFLHQPEALLQLSRPEQLEG
jgi:hypothetical protein